MPLTIKLRVLGLMLVLCTALVSCSIDNQKDRTSPKTIRVAVVPEESKEKLLNKYSPLIKYLSKDTGLKFELLIPETYEELLEMFHEDQVDLAHFGGFTFIKAHLKDQALPLVMRNVDTRFTSYFLVKDDHPAKTISEFRNMIFSFGSKLSTSGHLMPRFFLHEKKVIPEDFFSETHYSGSHDKTAYWVRDGKVDVGVANAKIVDKMFEDGRLKKNDVRVLWQTPLYSDYVWALQSKIGTTIQNKIRDAFLGLSSENEAHRQTLKGLNANHYIPADLDDFSNLKLVAETLAQL
jgi:phosphonate transport system substrate-binding protein